MPRTTDPTIIAALQANVVRPALMIDVEFGPIASPQHLKLATTNGDVLGGFHGVGSMLSISPVEEGLDVQARGCQATLSSLSPQVLALINTYCQTMLPVKIYFAVLDDAYGMIWEPLVFSGRTDQPTVTLSGDKGTVELNCESNLLDMNVSVERRYTNEDQQIEHPGDNGFRFVESIQEVAVYWGRTPSSKNNR